MTITKALTKTTNCTFRAKKWRGRTIGVPPHFRSGPVSPLSNSFRHHWLPDQTLRMRARGCSVLEKRQIDPNSPKPSTSAGDAKSLMHSGTIVGTRTGALKNHFSTGESSSRIKFYHVTLYVDFHKAHAISYFSSNFRVIS